MIPTVSSEPILSSAMGSYTRSSSCSSLPETNSRPKVIPAKRSISFSQIEIIELPVTLGDSPSVRDGPPVSCEWDAQRRYQLPLNVFETYRPKRRQRSKLLLSRQTRERILLQHGVSSSDMYLATLEVQRVQKDLLETRNQLRKERRRKLLLEQQQKRQQQQSCRSSYYSNMSNDPSVPLGCEITADFVW